MREKPTQQQRLSKTQNLFKKINKTKLIISKQKYLPPLVVLILVGGITTCWIDPADNLRQTPFSSPRSKGTPKVILSSCAHSCYVHYLCMLHLDYYVWTNESEAVGRGQKYHHCIFYL